VKTKILVIVLIDYEVILKVLKFCDDHVLHESTGCCRSQNFIWRTGIFIYFCCFNL